MHAILTALTLTAREQVILETLPEVYFAGGSVRCEAEMRASKYPHVFFGVGKGAPASAEESFTSRALELSVQAQRAVGSHGWLGPGLLYVTTGSPRPPDLPFLLGSAFG